MKIICLKVLICLMGMVFISSCLFEIAHTNVFKNHSCCKPKCHTGVKCQKGKTVCLCSYQTIQAYQLKRGVLFKPVLVGYLPQSFRFTYNYLSVGNVFHPPNL